MIKNRSLLPFLAGALIFFAFTHADDPLRKILSQLERYGTEFPQEKVHLHFDKSYYAAGDSIWLKAYVVTAEDNRLSNISNILYAELINDKDSIVQSLRLPLARGLGSGSFSLSDTLEQGNYRIRAYTRWMRNFDDRFFFDKIIPIGSVSAPAHTAGQHLSPGTTAQSTSSNSEMAFFPEGGDLVAGIRSKIAFKASSNGRAIEISGDVLNKSKAKVAEFRSVHAGLGAFMLHPLPGEIYTAHIRLPDGSERSFPLPGVVPEGYGLSAEHTQSDDLAVKIAVSPGLLSEGEMTLIAQSNGVVKYVSKSKMDKSILNANIPKKRFPTGIVQLTLFSPEQEPVAERLVFINHQDDLDIKVNTSKMTYQKREKVRMTLEVKDKEGKPAVGSFSLAVTDETKVPQDEANEVTILSNLLLTSDLKGFIEQPNYYFTAIDEHKVRHLDVLMMTHGWRRFVWKNILGDVFPALTFKPEKSIGISGKVTSLLSGKPVPGGSVMLLPLTDGDMSMLTDTVTDSQGRFEFSNLYFPDSVRFSVQARNLKDRKNTVIKIDQVPGQRITKKSTPAPEPNIMSSLNTYLISSRERLDELKRYGLFNRNIMLGEVKVIEKAVNGIPASRGRYGFSDKVITSAQLKSCMDLFTCLPRTGGIMIRNGDFYLTRGNKLLVLLDGVPVPKDDIPFISPLDIESIELFKRDAVLLITTKRGELTVSNRFMPGIISHAPKGYHKERIFYSPDYDAPKISPQMRDLRTTIFWAPHVITDSTGKAVVEFFNADGTGKYRTIVEGISLEGKTGRNTHRYSVE